MYYYVGWAGNCHRGVNSSPCSAAIPFSPTLCPPHQSQHVIAPRTLARHPPESLAVAHDALSQRQVAAHQEPPSDAVPRNAPLQTPAGDTARSADVLHGEVLVLGGQGVERSAEFLRVGHADHGDSLQLCGVCHEGRDRAECRGQSRGSRHDPEVRGRDTFAHFGWLLFRGTECPHGNVQRAQHEARPQAPRNRHGEREARSGYRRAKVCGCVGVGLCVDVQPQPQPEVREDVVCV